MKSIRLIFILSMMFSLTHCLSYDLSRHTIQQGNLLPASQVQRLKIGMSREDVYQLLGSSLVQNIFNPNRLDYAYSIQRGSKAMHIRNVALTLQHDRVVQIHHYP